MSAVFVFKVELCLPTKHIAQYFLNGDWRIDKWESGKSRLCDCRKDFMPWLPQSSQTVPHRGRSLSRRLKSGFCACTDCSVRTYTYVRSCTRIYAHTSNCVPTSQIFSPMSRCRHFMSRCPTDAVNCVLLMHCIVERNVYPTIVQQQPCLTSLMALWWIGSMPHCIFCQAIS